MLLTEVTNRFEIFVKSLIMKMMRRNCWLSDFFQPNMTKVKNYFDLFTVLKMLFSIHIEKHYFKARYFYSEDL